MVVLSLAERADRAKYRPRVLSLLEGGELVPRFAAAGVPVDTLDVAISDGPIAVLRAMRRYLLQHQPAILHTHNPTPHQYGALSATWARVPVLVHTKHGRNQLLSTRGRFLERVAGYLSDAVVPVSADAADVARDVDGVPAGRIQVIRNGIAATHAAPRRAAGGEWRVVHVARLNEVKDQPTLLRAARRVADHHPDFHLDIVGDGEERQALERLAAELGLEQVVHFHGFTDDVSAYLAGADLFALSSVSEGIALTLLEAMAAALPVVATDVGGNREVVRDGETGLLVPASDPTAMADAMIALLEDPSRGEAMGRAGRARVVQEFSLDRTAAEYEALYDRLLTRRGLIARPR